MIKGEIGCSCGIAACILMIITCFIKCSTKEEPEQSSYGFISYSLKWEQALSGHESPKKVRYCFYPLEQGAMTQIEGDAGGLKFTLPPDKYRLLVFNCDADNIAFRNMNTFETAEAYIPATKATGYTTSGRIPFYGIAIDELEVEANEGISNTREFSMASLIREVTIDIKVDGMEYIKECKGELAGVPAAFNLSKQEIVPEKTTKVNFETAPSKEGVKANIMILGTAPKHGETPPTTPTNEVKLDFTLNDGSTSSATLDLGESIGNTEGNNINVNVSVTVEKDASFTVKINNWEVSAGDDMVIE